MPTYINVRRFHWILLSIQVDAGMVDVMDPLQKDPKEHESIIYILQR
jgi:hypothetical protein